MKRRRWRWLLVVAAVICGLCWLECGDGERRPPDVRVADHLTALCGIAEDELDTPARGVDRLGRYLGDHGPAMLHDLGETVALIERIADDEAHDRRARAAHHHLRDRLQRCEDTWERFAGAVEGDPAARAALERGVTRLTRTLMILIGAEGKVPRLASWPRAVQTRLDALLPR